MPQFSPVRSLFKDLYKFSQDFSPDRFVEMHSLEHFERFFDICGRQRQQIIPIYAEPTKAVLRRYCHSRSEVAYLVMSSALTPSHSRRGAVRLLLSCAIDTEPSRYVVNISNPYGSASTRQRMGTLIAHLDGRARYGMYSGLLFRQIHGQSMDQLASGDVWVALASY